MDIKNVLALGGGNMGSKVSFYHAMYGYKVTQYDINDELLAKCKELHQSYVAEFKMVRPQFTDQQLEAGLARISYTSNLEDAAKDADLVTESVPEVFEIKKDIYTKLGKLCPEHTIFTTNTSTMLPSKFAEFTGRPDRFLALHYGNPVWMAPIAEVMKHGGTDNAVFEAVVKFAQDSELKPIRLEKEQPGYIINSLLVPWITAAFSLVVNGITTHEDVDKTWLLCNPGALYGPFGVLDILGFEVAKNVIALLAAAEPGNPQHQKNIDYLEKNYINRGNFGILTGQGFYNYPNPSFQNPDFLN